MDSLKQLRSIREITILVFCATISLPIGVFAVIRLLNGELIFGLHNTAISLIAMIVFIRVWVSHEIYFSGMFISSLCVAGTITVVYLGGVEHIYWIYPGFMAPFFMAGARTATILCFIGLALLLPKFWMLADGLLFLRVLLAFFVNLIFGVTFLAANNLHRSDLERKAKTDGLTGISNRRALDEVLRVMVSAKPLRKLETFVLMMDLDHFKAVNDRFGHIEGDRVLVEFAHRVEQFVASEGSIYRYGGEEFIVISRAKRDQGLALAERIRHFVETSEMLSRYAITISVGVAIMHSGDSPDRVLQRADKALLDAKAQGRNRVMVADETGDVKAYLRAV